VNPLDLSFINEFKCYFISRKQINFLENSKTYSQSQVLFSFIVFDWNPPPIVPPPLGENCDPPKPVPDPDELLAQLPVRLVPIFS